MTAPSKLREAVARLRDKIASIRAKLDAARGADCTRDEAVSRAAKHIERLRGEFERTNPQVAHFTAAAVRGAAPSLLAAVTLRVDPKSGIGQVTLGEIEPLLAYLDPDACLAALTRSIDSRYAARGPGLSEADRGAIIEQLESELLAAEVEEEHAIVEADLAGILIDRRFDADPRAVLATAVRDPS